jgi:hypothetical protein
MNKHLFPHYTSNPLFTANRWDWQPHRKLGQGSLVVICAGSTLLVAPTPRARLSLAPLPKSASNNLRKWFLSPTGRLNLSIITEGKLTVVLIIPSSWGFPTGPVRHQDIFWRRCRGEREFLQGESLTSNLFTLLLFCLVSLLYFVCILFIKNTKKLVPFIVGTLLLYF